MKNPKTWLVTGASRGFGLDISRAVLESGDRVLATVRSNPQQLQKNLDDNPHLLVVVMDVTDEAQVVKGVKAGIDHFGQIDILVNNAGNGLLSAIEEATDAEVKANYEVNVFGSLNVIRAVLPSMRERRAGRIINISSVGGLGAYVGWGVYGSTKFAIEGITEALAMELAPLGIYATVVAPGFFRTDFLDKSSLVSSKRIIADYAETVGNMRDFAARVNRQQPGDPQKLAQAFIKLGNAAYPPVHLPLGRDALDRFRIKTTEFEKDISNWYDTIIGTDYNNQQNRS